MMHHLPQKIDERSSIERLKALGATTFVRTTNLADAEKWLTKRKVFWGDRLPRREKGEVSNVLVA